MYDAGGIVAVSVTHRIGLALGIRYGWELVDPFGSAVIGTGKGGWEGVSFWAGDAATGGGNYFAWVLNWLRGIDLAVLFFVIFGNGNTWMRGSFFDKEQ